MVYLPSSIRQCKCNNSSLSSVFQSKSLILKKITHFQRFTGCKILPLFHTPFTDTTKKVYYLSTLWLVLGRIYRFWENYTVYCKTYWNERKCRLGKDHGFMALEPRQYKNDSIPSKNFIVLKLSRFFVTYMASEKERQLQT